MSLGTNRVRFATLDSNLLARKGEARPALALATWLDQAGSALPAEAVSRGVPGELIDRGAPRSGQGAAEVAIDRLRPNGAQPRRRMDEAALAELADSIRRHGILQPIVVRQDADDDESYSIIVGERRWRAAKLAGRTTVPVLVRRVADQEAFELALVENLQRENLDPLDEAAGYRRLIDEFGRTQEDVARIVGKSRSHVANTLRLLTLPDEVKTLVQDGAISAGHARAVLAAPDPVALAHQAATEHLTVRVTESLSKAQARPVARVLDRGLEDLARRIATATGVAPTVMPAAGAGVTLRFASRADVETLIARLEAASPLAAPANSGHEAMPKAASL